LYLHSIPTRNPLPLLPGWLFGCVKPYLIRVPNLCLTTRHLGGSPRSRSPNEVFFSPFDPAEANSHPKMSPSHPLGSFQCFGRQSFDPTSNPIAALSCHLCKNSDQIPRSNKHKPAPKSPLRGRVRWFRKKKCFGFLPKTLTGLRGGQEIFRVCSIIASGYFLPPPFKICLQGSPHLSLPRPKGIFSNSPKSEPPKWGGKWAVFPLGRRGFCTPTPERPFKPPPFLPQGGLPAKEKLRVTELMKKERTAKRHQATKNRAPPWGAGVNLIILW